MWNNFGSHNNYSMGISTHKYNSEYPLETAIYAVVASAFPLIRHQLTTTKLVLASGNLKLSNNNPTYSFQQKKMYVVYFLNFFSRSPMK